MTQQKINYVFGAVLVLLAMVLGYFGFTLPVTPEIPSPLPTPTPVDLTDVYVRLNSLETTQGVVDPGESFAIRERISIDARDDAYLYNGADLYVYSDDHDTQVFHVDGATGNTTIAGTANVGGLSASTGGVTVTDDLYVTGDMEIVGSISNPTHYITIADHVDIQTITGTAALTTQKVGSPTAAWCSISSASFTATYCSTLIVGTTVTASVWLSDSTVSPVGVDVDWLVIGIP